MSLSRASAASTNYSPSDRRDQRPEPFGKCV